MRLFVATLIGVSALVAVAHLSAGAPDLPAVESTAQNELSGSPRHRFKLPKMFDFETYKRIYHKSYATIAELLYRKQRVLAKVFVSLVSMVRYKRGDQTHFNSVNPLSDRSPAELKRMENPLLGEEFSKLSGQVKVKQQVRKEEESDDSLQMVSSDKVEELLDRIAKEYPNDEELSELREEVKWTKKVERRKKRNAHHEKLSLEKVYNTDEDEEDKMLPEALAKVRETSAFENPNHIQLEPQVSRRELKDNLALVGWYRLYEDKDLNDIVDPLSRINRMLAKYRELDAAAKSSKHDNNDKFKDEVFVDHRKSGCMWTPRYQDMCGCCYAFAITTLAEWIHCKNTGELLAFSEQYFLDCGHFTGLEGCNGGNPLCAGNFIHNFGLELRKNYPYLHEKGQCPHDENTDLETTGYIRMNFERATMIFIDKFEEFIEKAPILVVVSTEGGFLDYGGGVYEGANCGQQATHAMVLVGHGREDGQEYWLLRNSHSVAWGEGGYMKLAKKSDCIQPRLGYMLALESGANLIKSEKNTRHDIAKIKEQYMKRANI